MSICRWGILGTANIARKNWKAIWNAPNAVLGAVASRSRDRAEEFIQECQSEVPFELPPAPYGSYDELIDDPDISAVYIPLPTGMRKEWVIRAAEAGKHILAEKPCAISSEDLMEMLTACEANNVQYMDGVMFMHSERMKSVRESINDGEIIGEIKRISSHHCFRAPKEFLTENIRVHSELEPQGCVGDLAWYSIRFILWTLEWQEPHSVYGRMLSEAQRSDSPDSVPTEFSAELIFEDGVTASFYCSFLTENQQFAQVAGTKGYLHIPDFVLPFFGNEVCYQTYNANYRMVGCEFNMEPNRRDIAVAEYSNSSPNAQETKMIERLSKIALSGATEPQWPAMALSTQKVMDACLESAKHHGGLVKLTSD